MTERYRVGVDIGGTFTDIVLLGSDGTLHTKKISSSVDDYARAIVEGLSELFAETGLAGGAIEEIRQDGDCWWLTVKFPPSLAAQIVRKGSIAVDGISLTVAGVDEKRFDVQIVPFTWDHTTLKDARVNDLVNIETDMLGKYVLRAMDLYKQR